LVFGLYWSFAARDRAETASAEPHWSTVLHRSMVTVGVLLILLPAPGLVGRVLPASLWIVAAGLSIELSGVVLAVLARRSLGRNWSSEVRVAVDHELVRTGVYRRLRHPIYTGLLCLYLGLALQAGRLDALIGLLLIVLAYLRKIGLEERVLGDRFGAAFAAYRKSSWALIPPLF
jgi:protein-S-isoprenylcysteine O-methyltransferase Ste14